MKIAVIVPTFNRAEYLREALASVMAQERPADEIIVVDDGSKDHTALVCQEFPCRYLPNAHKGLSAARNTAMAVTDAELLVFLDDDDHLLPHSLRVQEQAFLSDPLLGVVYGRAHLIDRHGRPAGEHLKNHRPPRHFVRELLHENFVVIQTVMVRARVVRDAGGFRQTPAEDLDLWIRLALRGVRFRYLDLPLAEYRKMPGTLSAAPLRYSLAVVQTLENLQQEYPELLPAWLASSYYRVGRAALQERNFPQARRALQRACELQPRSPRFRAYAALARWPNLFGPLVLLLQFAKRAISRLLIAVGLLERRWGTDPKAVKPEPSTPEADARRKPSN